jgi:hypothetical protein
MSIPISSEMTQNVVLHSGKAVKYKYVVAESCFRRMRKEVIHKQVDKTRELVKLDTFV